MFEAHFGAAAAGGSTLAAAFLVAACFHLTGSRTAASFMREQAQRFATWQSLQQ